MSRKGIRQCKVHQRIHILRRRYDRSVLLGMTGMIVVLAACMGILLRETHSSGIPMVSAEVTMIPQNYVTLTDETAVKNLQRTLDLLEDDDDVQAVYHNWDE